jgi:hypothetical protein
MGNSPYSNNWGGPRPGAGRPKGSVDSRPREIREAMIQGAINSDYGKDPDHPEREGDLVRFFTNMANKNLDLFGAMLMKLIPRQISTQSEATIDIGVVYRSVDEVRHAMEDAGMSTKQIEAIQAMLPGTETEKPAIDDEAHDDEDIES